MKNENNPKTFHSNMLFIVLSLSLFTFSCAKLPIHKSVSYSQNQDFENSETILKHYDKKSGLLYGVATDAERLYLKIRFQDKKSLMPILRGGLKIHFNTLGNKKKDYTLNLEKEIAQRNNQSQMAMSNRLAPGSGSERLDFLLMSLNKVTWKHGDKEFVFYRTLNNDPISVNLYANTFGDLIYEVSLPKSEFDWDTYNEATILGIGIESSSSQQRSTGQMGNRPSGGGRSGGSMSGGRPGGMGGKSGGRSGGSMGGGRSGGMAGSKQMNNSSASGINYWFSVEL